MPNDLSSSEAPRPRSADLAWILLFIGVTAFAVAGMMGVIRL
jgi:flagellar basal body-associated protein FliL